jgi:peptidoglycan/LPS O-acetylase OafA/YrhL
VSAEPRDAGRTGLPYRPALDGVRALAVAGVLAFHGGIGALSGGFLGVDAFFVLSGYLITSLLLAEHAGSGRIAVLAFWGRRVRRLLPALLLMLVVVAAVSHWLVPPEELPALRWDGLAAVGYVANWRMADRDGDYFTATGTPSPLQHTWSLGIEEQFYLLWPLVLVGLLTVRARRSAPLTGRRRALLLAVCVGGAAASALTAALLYRRDDVDRVYYGTDTRAVAILTGCALAVLLAGKTAWPGTSRSAAPVSVRRRLVVAGVVASAATVVAWLLLAGNGGAAWLYRGGLALAAVAVAVVIAHAVLSPASATARTLASPPLVWLGRISYGVYLWHWPLFGWLDADATGLTGPALFAVRCAATLVVATASYHLLEMPVRKARWPRHRPRLAFASTSAAVAVTAAAAVFATVPPPVPPAAPIALDAALAHSPDPVSTGSADRSPLHRPGRRAGKQPRISFFGDSVSWSLAAYLPPQPELKIGVRGMAGCGVARLPQIRYIGEPHPNYPGCEHWDRRWRQNARADDPDLAVILLDRWELMDRVLDGRYQHVGEPAFDAYLERELDLAVRIVAERGAHVVILTAPYTRRAERPDGTLWPEDRPERVDAWNRLLRAAADRHHATVIDLNARVCPGGKFTWQAGGVRIRSDGLHFTPAGVQQWIAPWLLPQLARVAVHGPAG